MFARNIPTGDPYTPAPRRATPFANGRMRAASASASCTPSPAQLDPDLVASHTHSKRHSYHALRQPGLPPSSPVSSRALPFRSVTLQSQTQSQGAFGQPRQLPNLDPRPLLRTLNALLDAKTQRIYDHLDVDHLVCIPPALSRHPKLQGYAIWEVLISCRTPTISGARNSR